MQIDSHQRSTSSAELVRIVDDLTLRLQASESLELESVLAKYPSFVQEIRQLWPGLVCLANLGRSGDQAGIAWSNESSATEDISKQIKQLNRSVRAGRASRKLFTRFQQSLRHQVRM